MINAIIRFSISQKLVVLLLVVIMAGAGAYSLVNLPIDAVPDVTNVQVQVLTGAPSLAPLEIERQITFPVEVAMSGIPNVEEIRSVSKFGFHGYLFCTPTCHGATRRRSRTDPAEHRLTRNGPYRHGLG